MGHTGIRLLAAVAASFLAASAGFSVTASAQVAREKSVQTFSLSDDGAPGGASVLDILKSEDQEKGAKPLGVEGIHSRPKAMADEKLEASIATLNDLIEESDDDDPSKPEYLARLGEVYWDKAENFFNKAQGDQITSRLRQAIEAKDEGTIQKIEAERADLMEQRAYWQMESVNAYRRVVDNFPEYPALDETLYYLGFALVQMGKQVDAYPYFARLVRESPNSQYVPDALLNIGEYYFNVGQMEDALKIYTEVENFKDSTAYGLAIYKKGWCFFNLARHEEAMNQFLVVIDYTGTEQAAKSGYGRQLLKEAQRDLVMAYSSLPDGSPDSAIRVFKAISPDGYMELAIKLAEGYASQGDFQKSTRLYKNIIAEYASRPDSWKVVQFQREIFENVYRAAVKKEVVEEARRLIGLLDKFRAVAPKDQIQPEMVRVEELIRVVATMYHNEARKTMEDATLEFTHHLYNEYLRLFPDAEKSFTITYNYALLLQDIGKYELAAERFSQVVALRPNDPLAADAAHAAVSAYHKLLENQQNRAKSEDTTDTEAKEIPEFEQKLIAASDTYLKMAQPDSPDVVQTRFVRAMAYYKYNHFEEAAAGFTDIISRDPDHENAPDAARLLLSTLALLRDIPRLNAAADTIQVQPALMRGDVPDIIRKINEQKDFNACFDFEKKGLYSRAAECFLAYVAKFPTTPLKDRALINAGSNFFKARRVEDSLKVNEQLVNEFPNSDLAKRALFNIADTYRRLAVYSEAARIYETFVDNYPNHELTEEGLRFATMLRTGLGDNDLAIKDLRKYIKLFPKSEHIAGIAIEIAAILAKQGKHSQAIAEYNAYIKKYGQSGGPDRLLLSHLKIAQAYARMAGYKNYIASQQAYDKTIAVYDTMSDEIKQKVSPIGLASVAEAMFVKGEGVLEKMRGIKLSGDMKVVTDQIASKLALAEEAMKIFNTVEAFGQPNWTIAAFSRKGFGFQELAETIENTPAPRGLSETQKQFYREGLGQRAIPIWEKAKDSYRECIQLAQELKWYNKYSEEAEDALMKLDPEFRTLADLRPRPEIYSVNNGRMTFLAEKEGIDPPKWADANLEDRVRQAAEAADATPEALYNMGALQKGKGRLAESRSWFERAVSARADFDKAIAAIGFVLAQEGRISEAEAQFKAALKIDPANAIASAFYAARALSKRSFTEAINLARDGLVSDPDSRDAYAVLGAAYLEMGLIDAGLLVARNAISLDPTDGQIQNLMGIMFGRQTEVRQAVKMFSKAAQDAPELYDAWMNLGLVTLAYKDLKTAGDAFDRALSLKPASRDARLAKAVVLRGQNQGDAAMKILKELGSERQDPDVHFNLCLVYQENLSREEDALDECGKFLAMIPADHPKRKEVSRRIEGIRITIEALKDSPAPVQEPEPEPPDAVPDTAN